MPPVNLAPYPYTAEQQAIERRRQMAQLLQQQSLAPVESPPVPGANASWTDVLAKALQGYVGGRAQNVLDTKQKALEQRIQGNQADFSQQMAKALIPDLPTESQNISTPGPLADQGAGNAAVTLPANPDAQSQNLDTRNMMAQSLASPFPNQQKMGEIFMAKTLAEQEAKQKESEIAAQRQWDVLHRLIPEGSMVPDGKGGYTNPNPKAPPAIRPFSPGDYIPDPSVPGGFRQVGVPSSTLPQPAMSPERLTQEQTLKGSPGAPLQMEPPRSPARMAQDQSLKTPPTDQTVVQSVDDPANPGKQKLVVIDKTKLMQQDVTGDISKTPNAQLNRTAADTKAYEESQKSLLALEGLAKQNTYIADQAMADQYFNIVKPGSGARMNQQNINRLITPGPLKDKLIVWAQKLDQGQPLDATARQEMIAAARIVAESKAPMGQPTGAAPGPAGTPRIRTYNPATGKLE